ncbi:AAA family ATPase [Paenibacillus sp. LMG 31461]|uniref:AAA family ATPase n=1 Tax=Paenibacillus plantarum TaxID=2654975 RepID=A0ABX1XCL1_9BACL|nr:AAA family ATPase [Paenibacillus plantarum]NOU65776.1 AAA family ATPase [Paenibacillus plantarum]
MGILVKDVYIKNFRSLKEVSIELDDYTVIVGKNNSGKSNIIQAVNLAFDFSSVFREDIYISKDEPYDESKKIHIDVRILPIDANRTVQDAFDEKWSRAFGDSVALDNTTDKEYFAFRTEISYDPDKEIYTNIKYKIDNWLDVGTSKIGNSIRRETLESIENILVNAQRDISLDIRDKKSIWGKLTSKIKVSDTVRGSIETQLQRLNKKIVHESEILKSISHELKVTTAEKESKVDISPITRDIESLYKGMNIYYTNKNSLPTSVENLGLGVRSWAVFSTIKAEINSKIKKRISDELAYLPLILVEEPEVHVHPQAQRQLFSDINAMMGQKIITTHSPYILSQIQLDKIRYVRKVDACSVALPLLVDDLSDDDIRKIRRTVMNTRGEILYANAVVLAEGETEEQALTVFLREFFNKEPFELGINIIGVGGNNYTPFMRVLNRLSIKWYVFSDGETEALRDLKSCLKKLIGEQVQLNLTDFDNVFVIENGECFETYCLSQGYIKEITQAICQVESDPNYLEYYINHYNDQKGKGGIVRNYKADEDGGYYRATKDCIMSDKTKYPTAIAEEICKTRKKIRRIPQKLKDLFVKIENDLKEGGN